MENKIKFFINGQYGFKYVSAFILGLFFGAMISFVYFNQQIFDSTNNKNIQSTDVNSSSSLPATQQRKMDSIFGIVKSVNDNNVVINIASDTHTDSTAEATTSMISVVIASTTKIIILKPKNPNDVAKIVKNFRYANQDILPPSPYTQEIGKLSDIVVGSVAIATSDNEIKKSMLSFVATEINVQLPSYK